MHLIQPRMHERRAFLRRAARLAVAGAAAPFGMSLAAMGEAAAFDATDYKALVCVFLYGGNDHANTVVNFDEPSYAAYRSIRQAGPSPSGLAIDRTALAQTVLTQPLHYPAGVSSRFIRRCPRWRACSTVAVLRSCSTSVR